MARVKVGFVLLSGRDRPLASTRVSVLNMLPYLAKAGYEPHFVFEPDPPTEKPDLTGVLDRVSRLGLDIVYFQKVSGESAVQAAGELRARGIRTIYGVCDYIDNEMAAATDATVVVTEYLKGLYDPRLQHKIRVVHDGLEKPSARKRHDEEPDRPDDRLKAVLVTSSQLYHLPVIGPLPAFLEVTVVGQYAAALNSVKRAKIALSELQGTGGLRDRLAAARTMLNRRFHTVPWDREGVYDAMAAADVGIIPVHTNFDPLPSSEISRWQVKSENRLTLKMAMGLPVIASPVPAYLPIIEQGRNGFIASSRQEWMDCLQRLRDPVLRREIGERARATVIDRFSQEAQAELLLEALDRVMGAGIEPDHFENTVQSARS